MSGTFVLLLVLLGVLVLAVRWFVRARPHDVAHALRAFVTAFGALAGTGLLMTGRFGLAIVTLGAMGFALRSLLKHRKGAEPWTAAGGGDEIAVETPYLRMRLDRATGDLAGEVRQGPFAGRSLDGLSEGELLRLVEDVAREDGQGLPVLETYLDRRFPDWRQAAGAGTEGAGPASGPMDPETALKILGLEPGASPDEVRRAHRRLMANLHPDRGGSDYLASQINRARDTLLQGR